MRQIKRCEILCFQEKRLTQEKLFTCSQVIHIVFNPIAKNPTSSIDAPAEAIDCFYPIHNQQDMHCNKNNPPTLLAA
jgi:hypothetical protein